MAEQAMDPNQARINLQRMFSSENMQSKDPSVQFKEQGNQFFKQGNYQEAMNCYNKAIVSGPRPSHFLLFLTSIDAI